MRLRFTARALRQFSSIAEYISQDNLSAASKVGWRIQKAAKLLETLPSIARTGVRQGTRELSVPGLPYVIVYRALRDEVVVLGIYHVRQLRPGQDSPPGS